jgi:hypothetical protein
LFTEEFDVAQRQMHGNLPQGFVHSRLLASDARLIEIPGLLSLRRAAFGCAAARLHGACLANRDSCERRARTTWSQ